MKKILLVVFLVLTLPTLVLAQVPRNPSQATVSAGHIRSNVANAGFSGLDVQGNPGYIALTGVSTKSGYLTDYYLWVSETGKLCVASYATISAYSSFPNGDWQLQDMNAACTVVGGQS